MKTKKFLGIMLILGLLIFFGCKNSTEPTKNNPPVITSLIANPGKIEMSGSTTITCNVNDPDEDQLTYEWDTKYGGSFEGSGNTITWTAPYHLEGNNYIFCEVSDGKSSDIDSVNIEINQTTATQFTVTGYSNIYGAGRSSPPGNPEGSANPPERGKLPPEFRFAAKSGRFLTFPGVTTNYPSQLGPEGLYLGEQSSWTTGSYNSISGIRHDSKHCLVGVFLGDNKPTEPAPAKMCFTNNFNLGGTANFLEISPLLQQTFLIGDGQTGNAELQKFNIPENATRLFLGIQCYDGSVEIFYFDTMGDSWGELFKVSVLINSK